MITVAIVGPESTGKTTLAKSLAKHFNTSWSPEFAREYLNQLDGSYVKEDLIDIAKGHLKSEKEHRKNAKGILFLDTDLFVLKIWSEFKYGDCDPWILQQLSMNQASFYLLTYHDIPYEEDPLRETPEKRPELFDLYEKALQEAGAHYLIVRGDKHERMEMAIQEINAII